MLHNNERLSCKYTYTFWSKSSSSQSVHLYEPIEISLVPPPSPALGAGDSCLRESGVGPGLARNYGLIYSRQTASQRTSKSLVRENGLDDLHESRPRTSTKVPPFAGRSLRKSY